MAGFWTSLGGFAGDLIGGGTGEVIRDIGKGADIVAPILSNSGKTAATNRGIKDAQQFERQNQQDQLDRTAIAADAAKTTGQVNASDAAVNQQKELDAARSAGASAAFKGALAKNIQDVSFDRGNLSPTVANVHFSGGLRPSAFGPELRTAGATLNASGQNSLDHPPTFPTIDPVTGVTPKAEVAPPSDESIWEKLAGPLSLGLTVAGAAANGHAATHAPPTITPNAPGSGANDTTGATVSPADIMAFLANHPSFQTPAASAASPFNVGRNVDFGPGVLPTPPTAPGFGGVTFAPPTSGGG